jgi:hypothetical protein
MRPLEKFYKDADDILKRMNHDDAILLIQLAGNLCTDARIYGYDSGREHEIEMNRIRNI